MGREAHLSDGSRLRAHCSVNFRRRNKFDCRFCGQSSFYVPFRHSVDPNSLVYYAGFVLAIYLCRSLGAIFFIPMLLDMAFNLALNFHLLEGWDIRLLMVGYGFAVFLWVLALSGAFNKTTFVAVLLLDLTLIYTEILPSMQAAGTGQDFWFKTSTGIVEVWLLSTFVVVSSIVIRSTLIAKIRGKFVDLLTNPKKRFLLPIGAWAGIILLSGQLRDYLPPWIVRHRFDIAAQILVWGWVALELPFFIMYHRVKRRYQ